MEWILVLGSVSREKKEPRSSDKVQTTCPRGRKMAKASERADGREEVGSEGTKAVDLITSKHHVCCRKQVQRSRHLRYLGPREERKQWV